MDKYLAQYADDWDGGAAANGASSAEVLHAEALRELASVQAAATAAMAESTDLRRRNETLEAEVGLCLASGKWQVVSVHMQLHMPTHLYITAFESS
jgi:hypothetical protein